MMSPVAVLAEAGTASPPTSITLKRFDAPGSAPRPAVMLLHGSDGLSDPGRYTAAATTIAAAGFTLPKNTRTMPASSSRTSSAM